MLYAGHEPVLGRQLLDCTAAGHLRPAVHGVRDGGQRQRSRSDRRRRPVHRAIGVQRLRSVGMHRGHSGGKPDPGAGTAGGQRPGKRRGGGSKPTPWHGRWVWLNPRTAYATQQVSGQFPDIADWPRSVSGIGPRRPPVIGPGPGALYRVTPYEYIF